ncbi:hypothetical protein OsI_10989 [Oryza sativa Indica Group]|uniref:Uncharacterized protein n=2 Tax=Oryza sativa TaxID=4530 RepID=B9F7B6_ORYSJ|nr:hypothetical protein OsI_10989 [Oryza sativa Indica Group]EEE58796.1 hypothetical protein OsJ_10336 [Oryza sativa Japonica Group]
MSSAGWRCKVAAPPPPCPRPVRRFASRKPRAREREGADSKAVQLVLGGHAHDDGSESELLSAYNGVLLRLPFRQKTFQD